MAKKSPPKKNVKNIPVAKSIKVKIQKQEAELVRISSRGLKTIDTSISDSERSFIDTKLNSALREKVGEVFADAGKDVLKEIEALSIDYSKAGEMTFDHYVEQEILPHLKKKDSVYATAFSNRSNKNESVKDILNLEVPLRKNPLFAKEVLKSKLSDYSELAGIKNEKLSALLSLNIDPDDFSMEDYEQLASNEVITSEERNKLHFTFELAKLTDDHIPLIRSLQTSTVKSVKELAQWQKKDWLEYLRAGQVETPSEVNTEKYIENIMENLKKSFPSSSLLHNSLSKLKGVSTHLNALKHLAEANSNFIKLYREGRIEWGNIDADNKQKTEESLVELIEFVNTYKHLGVGHILDDEKIDLRAKQQLIDDKIRDYETFVVNNNQIDINQVNFFDKDETGLMNWEGVDQSNYNGITKQLMAYQRVSILSDDIDHRVKLLAGGFDSAGSISDISFDEFITRSGLPINEAQFTYDKANETSIISEHAFEMARQALKDAVGNGLYVANWDLPDYTNQLKEIDGFEELFGSQDYCDCDHCRSIFSPAAYFVDLMHFIEKNVSDKVFKTRQNHSLYLKNRRPDLWTLKLSCENTNKLIPYLDVVNKVLEEYLKRALSITDVYSHLNSAHISFNLPFNLYLEELRVYLSHFNISLFNVFQVLDHSEIEIWRERLKINPEERKVIITPDITDNVKKRIGDPVPASFMKFGVKEFIRFAGITRQQLNDLLNGTFSKQLAPLNIIKEQSTDPLTDPLINYVERIVNLSNERLDFLHRYLRLWRKTGWTLREFDLIIGSLKTNDIIPSTADADKNGIIGGEAIMNCAILLELQDRLKFKTEELTVLFGNLSETSVKDNQQSFFIRAFTDKLFESTNSIAFHHAYINNDGITDPKLGLLLRGLAVSEGELIQLFNLLETQIVFDASGNTVLTKENISLLYRHARLAKSFKFSVEDFILTLKLNFSTGNVWVDSLDKIFSLLEFKTKLQQTKLKVSHLWFIINGEEIGSTLYKTVPTVVHEMLWNLQLQNSYYFDAEFLSDIPGFSAKISSEIIEEMQVQGLVVQKSLTEKIYRLTLAYQLAQDFTSVFTAISASVLIVGKVVEIRGKFESFHIRNIIPNNLSKVLNIAPLLFEALLPFTTTPIADASMNAALHSTFDELGVPQVPADLFPIEALVKEYDRLLFLFEKTDLKEANILFVAGNHAVVGITSPIGLSVRSIFNIASYKSLLNENTEKLELLQQLLIDYQTTLKLNDEALILLAETWETDKTLLLSLTTFITLPSIAIEAVMYLKKCLEICKTLGINGESLVKLKETGLSDLIKARDIIVGAFASKFTDEQERTDKLEPYHDKINTKKRDALCDFIIAHNKQLKFYDLSDLYAYFLLDVEMSGCFRTSWIVAANSSLQLYIHRCLMNLEQAGKATLIPDGNNDPDDDAYEFVKVPPSYIPANEWEWRKNYRVWEANRKVFLYPENYILPELRDNKTSLFKDLEDELLQQKITIQSTEKAYQKYLSQFAELARLKIAGSYFHAETDSYYFFGKTNADPPLFYFREWRNEKTWTAWEKIELAINASHVSAIIYAGKLYLFWTEIKVEEVTSISGGSSSSEGYNHELELLYSSKDENNTWASPQRFSWSEKIFPNDLGTGTMNRKTFPGIKDKKLYAFYSDLDFTASLAGHRRIDLFNNKLIGSDFTIIPSDMLMPTNSNLINLKGNGTVELIPVKSTYNRHEARADDELVVASSSVAGITSGINADLYQPEISVVGNKYEDFIFRVGNQQYLIKRRSNNFWTTLFGKTPALWRFIRIGTSLPDKLGEKLFMEGLDKFLSLNTQKFTEDVLPFTITAPSYLDAPSHNPNSIDFKGAYGDYYRELFFHIPFLIASHLNANHKFKESDWWYRKIFDPTSAEFTNPEKDRNWQFIEFRGLGVPKLQEILTDSAAIQAYKKDPFNPHAIARLRLSAYQKTIVMKYIDNLLDWGDNLFAQDTMESINEATMLYIMASDILGKRPVKLGKCETATESQLTYETLGPLIDKGSEFLIQLENYTITSAFLSAKKELTYANAVNKAAKNFISPQAQYADLTFKKEEFTEAKMFNAIRESETYQDRKSRFETVDRYDAVEKEKAVREPIGKYKEWEVQPARPPHRELIKQKVLAFCIPHNEELLKYWDRVEDRLFKIRNCMNISGVRRQLALFQPPIDPMMLVKAKAAGLSLEDVLNALNKPLPHYRCLFLLEKAKQLTQTVQSFGSSLLSALEKKDVEELMLIRSVNEKEILELTKQIKKQAVQEAQNQQLVLQAQEKNIQNKISYYSGLIDEGLTGWEIAQQVSKHVGTAFHGVSGAMHLTEAIALLIPNVGSPFAMTYGGKQLGKSFEGFADWLGKMGTVADAISASAAMEATFQRREEEWDHQLLLATQDLKSVQKQVVAAELKVSINERELLIHDKNIEHLKEIDDFYKGKFTNLGLYNYMATTLNRLYREAYNITYDIAKMAERTYQSETGDNTIFLAPDNWQFDKAGLLAGEKLLLQLHRLEKAYIENNARNYEMTQSISLYQWSPDKLIELKQKGSCSFQIPELAFDMFYPGQYKRIIKSVRLTMPCLAGPHANISCKLSLLESFVRQEPSLDSDPISVPVQKLKSIATSTAENDGGMFEMNFNDERYLPFEGAGAISNWAVELPNKLRSFDYNSISDVILQISYTAKDDGAFKELVEQNIVTNLQDFATANGLFKLFSLKHDFGDVFHKLMNTTTPQTAEFEISKKHLPYFLSDKDLSLVGGKIFIKAIKGQSITTGGLSLKLNTFNASSWTDFPTGGSVDPTFILKEGTIPVNGNPFKKWKIDAGSNGLVTEEVDDILILLKYNVL